MGVDTRYGVAPYWDFKNVWQMVSNGFKSAFEARLKSFDNHDLWQRMDLAIYCAMTPIIPTSEINQLVEILAADGVDGGGKMGDVLCYAFDGEDTFGTPIAPE